MVLCTLLSFSSAAPAQQKPSAYNWLDNVSNELRSARELAQRNQLTEAQRAVMRAYLDSYEPLEAHYGPGAKHGAAELIEDVRAGEAAFHKLMRSADARELIKNASSVELQINRIRSALAASGVSATPQITLAPEPHRGMVGLIAAENARTPEVRAILQGLIDANTAYTAGNASRALALVEHAYLEGFEPIEARLPSELVDRVEKTIHLQLRPAIQRKASAATVGAMLGTLGADMRSADRFLAEGNSTWFTIFNSFVIIVREGLEAVLLIAALLAALTAIGAEAKHRRQIVAGVTGGVLASIGTWFVADTLLPISGANRELLEGVTALVAVAVLLYVANWLFQKTYIHDWKDYLRSRVNSAVSRRSAFAMAALAFAAVYREGFETVLFYQALAYDSSVTAILAGLIPGLLLISALAYAILRAGVKLPLKKVFAGTNAVLMYLAFVFIGKGLYNLQEAGVFAPQPLPLPDHPVLRQLFGFYPLMETIAAQAAFLLLLAGTYLWYRRRMRDISASAGKSVVERPKVVA